MSEKAIQHQIQKPMPPNSTRRDRAEDMHGMPSDAKYKFGEFGMKRTDGLTYKFGDITKHDSGFKAGEKQKTPQGKTGANHGSGPSNFQGRGKTGAFGGSSGSEKQKKGRGGQTKGY